MSKTNHSTNSNSIPIQSKEKKLSKNFLHLTKNEKIISPLLTKRNKKRKRKKILKSKNYLRSFVKQSKLKKNTIDLNMKYQMKKIKLPSISNSNNFDKSNKKNHNLKLKMNDILKRKNHKMHNDKKQSPFDKWKSTYSDLKGQTNNSYQEKQKILVNNLSSDSKYLDEQNNHLFKKQTKNEPQNETKLDMINNDEMIPLDELYAMNTSKNANNKYHELFLSKQNNNDNVQNLQNKNESYKLRKFDCNHERIPFDKLELNDEGNDDMGVEKLNNYNQQNLNIPIQKLNNKNNNNNQFDEYATLGPEENDNDEQNNKLSHLPINNECNTKNSDKNNKLQFKIKKQGKTNIWRNCLNLIFVVMFRKELLSWYDIVFQLKQKTGQNTNLKHILPKLKTIYDELTKLNIKNVQLENINLMDDTKIILKNIQFMNEFYNKIKDKLEIVIKKFIEMGVKEVEEGITLMRMTLPRTVACNSIPEFAWEYMVKHIKKNG